MNNLSSNNPLRASSLYCMNNDNDTVVSGMTEISGGSFPVNNNNSINNNITTRQQHNNSHSHHNNNFFDPIVEEDDEIVDGSLNAYDDGSNSRKSVMSRGTTTTTNNKNNNSGGATGSFITNDHQPPQRRPPLGRLNSNNSLMSNNAQSVVSSQERHRPSAQPLLSQQRGHEPQLQQSYTSSLQDDQQSTTTTSYDNTRLVTHTLKRENAIREINVQNYQDDNSILNADEVTSLPEEYVCDEYGVRYHPKKLNESLLPTKTILNDVDEEDNKYQSLNSQYDNNYNSPFNTKNRKWYTILTIIAAVTLALCGLIQSLTLLKDDDRSS